MPGEGWSSLGNLGGHACPLLHAVVMTAILSSVSLRPSELPSSFSSQIYGLIWNSNSFEWRLHQSLPGTARHISVVASARDSSNNH